jgi:hypothetical protein
MITAPTPKQLREAHSAVAKRLADTPPEKRTSPAYLAAVKLLKESGFTTTNEAVRVQRALKLMGIEEAPVMSAEASLVAAYIALGCDNRTALKFAEEGKRSTTY